jgi:hypothetical protein
MSLPAQILTFEPLAMRAIDDWPEERQDQAFELLEQAQDAIRELANSAKPSPAEPEITKVKLCRPLPELVNELIAVASGPFPADAKEDLRRWIAGKRGGKRHRLAAMPKLILVPILLGASDCGIGLWAVNKQWNTRHYNPATLRRMNFDAAWTASQREWANEWRAECASWFRTHVTG